MEEEEKKEIKDGLSNEEIEEIKRAFNKYDINKTGKINPKIFLKEMASMGLNIKAPLIFNIMKELDTEENEKNGGISIDGVVNLINEKLGNTGSEDGIKHIFDLFKENSEDNIVSLNSLKKMASSFGIVISDEEIKNMLERSSESGEGLTFDEFCKVMIKQN